MRFSMFRVPFCCLGLIASAQALGAGIIDSAGVRHTPFFTFDDLPATPTMGLPGSSSTLSYSTTLGSSGNLEGWRSSVTYSGGIFDTFFRFRNSYNTPHMGYDSFGYLEIDGANRVAGNSLRLTITGGKNAASLPDGKGLPVGNKGEYLAYLASGQNPVDSSMPVGNPYLYFVNSSSKTAPTGFGAAQGATSMTLWVRLPESWNVGSGGYGVSPRRTLTFGPFSQVMNSEIFPPGHASYSDTRNIGNHFYHEYAISGGGWAKIHLDSHPNHNNAWSDAGRYPYPSKSTRSIGPTYFNNLYRIYFAGRSYEGVSVPAFSFWMDELEFVHDPEPQNNETISNVAVMYNATKRSFEVGFLDKYQNCSNNFPNYELRYSFAPITNANWGRATPAHILVRPGFRNTDNLNGRIVKNVACVTTVWAEFKLADADQAGLGAGSKVYLALKDVSQAGGNGELPAASGQGRDYTINPAAWDYAGDKAALLLINRFDYTIIEGARATSEPPGVKGRRTPKAPVATKIE